jgi:pyruvate dehydrogenase E2 component (dihydrolipoamide acetyltransferase)
MKKAMVKQMVRSLEIPQFSIETEVDCGKIMSLRKEISFRPSVTTIFAKAVADTLKKYPILNSSFVDTANIAVHDEIGLGIAADTPKGLVVPVIHNAGNLSLKEFHEEMESIKEKSKEGNFRVEDLTESTFTISNLGMFNVTSFKAIVNAPQTGILALSKIVERPVVYDGELKIARIMKISLSADHRVTDGAGCARFLSELAKTIEAAEMLHE